MKYILAIGIFFKKFRGSTKIKLYSDDFFIDEIVLDQNLLGTSKSNIVRHQFDKADDLIHLGPKPGHPGIKNFPEKLLVYEIDESVLGEKILFKMDDKNSNYTNGFMTSSNLVGIDNIMLFPKHMFHKEKLHRTLEFLRKRCNEVSLDQRTMEERLEYERKYTSWPSEYYVFDTDKDTLYGRAEWLGGQKNFHVKVMKKFGLHFLWNGQNNSDNLVRFGNPNDFIEYIYYYRLLNIVNENQ